MAVDAGGTAECNAADDVNLAVNLMPDLFRFQKDVECSGVYYSLVCQHC